MPNESKVVFLYDDDPRVYQPAEQKLRERGFAVIAAHDGVAFEDAAEQLQEVLKDPGRELVAVVIDLWVPEFTGFEVVERLMELPGLADRQVWPTLIIWTDNPHPERHSGWIRVQAWSPRRVLIKNMDDPARAAEALAEAML